MKEGLSLSTWCISRTQSVFRTLGTSKGRHSSCSNVRKSSNGTSLSKLILSRWSKADKVVRLDAFVYRQWVVKEAEVNRSDCPWEKNSALFIPNMKTRMRRHVPCNVSWFLNGSQSALNENVNVIGRYC